MESVKFGKTGLQVSKLCLGCMTYKPHHLADAVAATEL